eukprot:Seg661.1 transcript_id=Seg661.1/GoldUCD/mRNA.D3Y31 product=Cubilin protein_id=Seg661.1/GoldUCD/D3Y31
MATNFLLPAVFLLVLSSFGRCNGKCTSGTFDATTSVSFVTNENYGNDEDCTISIRPSAMHSSGYYLAIKWLVFEVEGEMPECEHDFVEVTLTRSSVSIGKFCSDNLVSTMPFDIYSADGHAQIKFKSDSSVTHAGFKFLYQLKSKPLVPSDSSLNICGNKPPAENMKSGIMYYNGWPVGNQVAPWTFCSQQIDTGLHSETKIVMMDLDLKGSTSSQCNSSQPNVEILQSSKPYSKRSDMLNFATSISGPMCGKLEPKVYTATERYIYIHFNRANASLIANRGFVIGFLSYDISHNSAKDIAESIQMLSSLTTERRRFTIPTKFYRRRVPFILLRRRIPVILRRRFIIILRRRTPILRRRTTTPSLTPTTTSPRRRSSSGSKIKFEIPIAGGVGGVSVVTLVVLAVAKFFCKRRSNPNPNH